MDEMGLKWLKNFKNVETLQYAGLRICSKWKLNNEKLNPITYISF